uniref:Uncharacterized protein n=1 Tax=Branchiostoma floridae TaxID=7739 RepID=C3YHF3_BRAFL|eukprot:XP_002604378.1 hypothetical protein BRAFLDRAFT_73364 [Branchiostoma floridae]
MCHFCKQLNYPLLFQQVIESYVEETLNLTEAIPLGLVDSDVEEQQAGMSCIPAICIFQIQNKTSKLQQKNKMHSVPLRPAVYRMELKRLHVDTKRFLVTQKIPGNFEDTRDGFQARIEEVVRTQNMPDINCDQTEINVVPVRGWTLAEEGSKQACFIELSFSE